MANNNNLHAARKAKNDEFYTQLTDIEKELWHYKDQFENKTVFLNCDDPEESEFWFFFSAQFDNYKLKRLIATHYDSTKPTYMLEKIRKEDGTVEQSKKTLMQNGDFRSPESVALLDECDIVVTNPPFSLFKEYVPLLIEHGKKFLVLGDINAVSYKEIFPLIKDGKIWAGYSFNKTMEFRMPDSYELKGKAYVDENGVKHGFVPGICWFTNLEVKKRQEELILWKEYTPEAFPKYDNYDAIHVDLVKNIPCDYDGIMGVPISFLKDYCPEQFEILGITENAGKGLSNGIRNEEIKIAHPLINGERQYQRILIRRKR